MQWNVEKLRQKYLDQIWQGGQIKVKFVVIDKRGGWVTNLGRRTWSGFGLTGSL